MNANAFDALSRRASLATVSAAGLAALAGPYAATAAKNKKKKKGDVNKLCKKQVAQCSTFYAEEQCGGNQACLIVTRTCCALLGTCNSIGFFECIAEAM